MLRKIHLLLRGHSSVGESVVFNAFVLNKDDMIAIFRTRFYCVMLYYHFQHPTLAEVEINISSLPVLLTTFIAYRFFQRHILFSNSIKKLLSPL